MHYRAQHWFVQCDYIYASWYTHTLLSQLHALC